MTIDGIRQRLSNQTWGQAAPADVEEATAFTVGNVCLAPRIFDRRRARAIVEKIGSSKGTCLVTWVYPRQRGELPCRYWKEVSRQFVCVSRKASEAVWWQQQLFLGNKIAQPFERFFLRRLLCMKKASLLAV